MSQTDERTRALLRLSLSPGLGPIRIARLLDAIGSAEEVLRAAPSRLERVRGIGPVLARRAAEFFRSSDENLEHELALIERYDTRILVLGEAGYPALLAELPSAPPLLFVRGELEPDGADRYPVAIVGSRRCTAYGLEQAARFGGVLAGSGLTIVSGGARGIDTAAHRAAVECGGRTIAVLGCGLARAYPPENADLYDRIAASGRGAVVSELPMSTPPSAENFPARNRIISGLSLGVVVIEASERSGALITARLAGEEHGREVMAVPGRADSPASRGVLALVRDGGASLVLDPGDVIAQLETPAHHQFRGTHSARYGQPESALENHAEKQDLQQLSNQSLVSVSGQGSAGAGADPVLRALADGPCTPDELIERTGLEAGELRARLTLLEIQRRVERRGGRLFSRV